MHVCGYVSFLHLSSHLYCQIIGKHDLYAYLEVMLHSEYVYIGKILYSIFSRCALHCNCALSSRMIKSYVREVHKCSLQQMLLKRAHKSDAVHNATVVRMLHVQL